MLRLLLVKHLLSFESSSASRTRGTVKMRASPPAHRKSTRSQEIARKGEVRAGHGGQEGKTVIK